MGCIEYKSYYWKEAEWNLLLAGLGITEWYGLSSKKMEIEKTKENVHRILADLYQKNVMDWENGCAVINQPFSGLFDSLLKSRFCITIQKQKERTPLRCCYIGEKDVVITEKSQREKEALCVFSLSKEDFISFVIENVEVSEGIFEESGQDSFSAGEEIFVLKLKNCRNGQLKCELILQESGLQTFLIIRKNDVIRIPYRLSKLKEYLQEWLYEEGKT